MKTFLLFLLVSLSQQNCSWEKCNDWSKEKNVLTAHLIPHTHDDLGWIKTVDEYYWGAKPELVPVGVQYIYNTVIDELEKNPERRFSFAETGFLWRWIDSHHDFERHRLQKLVANGQIELIGGGWVQNDEAAAHYVDIVDQMTFGLKRLRQLFGKCGVPEVAWQIDPFGHSRELASLFAQMGYTSLFFARIHYLEKELRLNNKSLEFVWNASDDLKTQLLTGAFYQDNYGPPEGFCFDSLCGDEPFMDNPKLEGFNVPEKVNDFVKHVKKQASYQRSPHVMLLMGSDFQYTNANSWYTNLDKLIEYVNANSSLNVKVIYSTPACYVKALLDSEPQLTYKNDDFFPYASSEHSYWTGYFTSRPTFKGMIRDASAFLQMARRMEVLADLGDTDDADVNVMAQASALAQHHDAVTGTAKENVTRDYRKHLDEAFKMGEIVANDFLSRMLPKKTMRRLRSSGLPHFVYCPLLNETKCDTIKDAATFAVTFVNSRADWANETISIPFYSKQAQGLDSEGSRIEMQITKTTQTQLEKSQDSAPYVLWISVKIPPLGFATYIIDNSTSILSTTVDHPRKLADGESAFLTNKFIRLSFNSDGYLQSYTNLADNKTFKLQQQFYIYEGMDNSTKPNQPSGAYIFRPKSPTPKLVTDQVTLVATKGQLVEEVRQWISPWVCQTIRLVKDKPEVQFSWTIGPIPKENNGTKVSKEIVTRYTTDIKSNGEFFTDSNGRQMMRRKTKEHPSFVYKDTEPVAANYYPITNRAFITDGNQQLTILVDRAEGAYSTDGMLEIMLHRRTFFDDHWGVDEPLDEPGNDGKGLIARGTHTLLLTNKISAAAVHRPRAVQLFNSPRPFFTQISNAADYRKLYNMQYSGLTRPLPDYVNLLSLEPYHKTNILIRLEHIFGGAEDTEDSRPKQIDLNGLFAGFTIKASRELMLAGNRNVTDGMWKIVKGVTPIDLTPMQIRTFELEIERH